MTTNDPKADEQVEHAEDPHTSKISPDDPRLRIRASSGRTLRKGPAIAIAVVLGGGLAVTLAVTLSPAPKSTEKKAETGPQPAGNAPVLPETIRNPEAPRVTPPSTRSDAGNELHPRSSYAGGRDVTADQYARARSAGILFDGVGSQSSQSQPAAALPFALPSATNGASQASVPFDPNMQGRKNAFLDDGATKSTDYVRTRLQHPRSPYEVKAGTILPATLVTAINSDLPGPVIGQVRENVYDTVTGNHLLIPQGSRLLAQYDSMVAWGQERVLVCWQRLIFPNGDSLGLECMPAADLAGGAGLADEVDEHWGRIVKGAAVASLLAATTSAVAGNTQGQNPTLAQNWARGAAGEINQAGQAITQRNINIQPTITVRPGSAVNVIVTKDLLMPGPYQ
jgi:type IV secretion system protein VirB10